VGKKLNHIPQKCWFYFLQKRWEFVFKTHKSIGLIEGWKGLLIIYIFGLKREDGKKGKKFNCKYIWFTRGRFEEGRDGKIKLCFYLYNF
jgi:hypothetical protein